MLRLQAGTLGPGEVSANIETGGSGGVRSQCAADHPLPRWGPRKAPLSPGVGGGPAVSQLAWGGESGASPRGEPAFTAGSPMGEADQTRDGRAGDRGVDRSLGQGAVGQRKPV